MDTRKVTFSQDNGQVIVDNSLGEANVSSFEFLSFDENFELIPIKDANRYQGMHYIVWWCRFYPSIPMYVVPVMTTIVLYDRTVSSEYDKAHTRELHQLARSQDPDLLRWPLIGGELVTWPGCSALIGAQVPAGPQEEEHQDCLRLRAAAGPAGRGAHQVQGVSLGCTMDQIQGVSSEPPATLLTTAAVPRDVGLVRRQLGWGGGWAASRVTPILWYTIFGEGAYIHLLSVESPH